MFVNYAPEVGLYLFTQYMRLLFWWYFIVHTIIEKKTCILHCRLSYYFKFNSFNSLHTLHICNACKQ